MTQTNFKTVNNTTTSNLQKSLPQFLFLCLGLCFSLILCHTSIAQTNTFVPADGGNKGSGAGTAPMQVKDGQIISDAPASQAMSKGSDASENYNDWKIQQIEEKQLEADIASGKLGVNYDSLFNFFAAKRKLFYGETEKVSVKIIPYTSMGKLFFVDSILYKKIMPVNTLYGMLLINSKDLSEKETSKLEIINRVAAGFTINTYDIINTVLPPLLIQDRYTMKAADYEQVIHQFFYNTPELIYNCNKSFVKMIERKQYDKLLKLQLNSKNTIDLRGNAKNNQVKK